METSLMLLLGGALLVIGVALPLLFRIVVPTNEVQIVQSAKRTVSYGKGQEAGNVFYKWPAWVPIFGVRTISLPVSVFDQTLDAYAAYDKGRVPFVIDVMAFFRITDSNMAAQRVHSFDELLDQLKSILQGAVRSILATSEIDEILEGRGKFGEMFTKEVDHQLVEWGVQNVKCIELMDIRDAEGSKVISNIMAKKKSFIEMESRTAVANNNKIAGIAEITATQEVQVRQQEAEQQVGTRTAEKDKQIGIAHEQANQAIKDELKITMEKTYAVNQVEHVRTAEITRQAAEVLAQQVRQVMIYEAEGKLAAAKLHADGVRAEGEAEGAAELAMQMAPVTAQINLAKEIGGNAGYQKYLVATRQIEAGQAVGIEQAKALEKANVKVIANTGSATEGMSSAMSLFTPEGGLKVGAALETLAQTPVGAAIIGAVTGNGHAKDTEAK